ncbi:hypothetical protein IW261DRAFT_1288403, partial [Armillaria novae-zelandiae]
VAKEVGANREGLKLNPWMFPFVGTRSEDPTPIFLYLTTQVEELYPDFAFIYVIEAHADGLTDLS